MAFYRERGLREFSKEVTSDGIGIGGGFIVGGTVGRFVENMFFKTPVNVDSPMTDKLLAWASNNGAKAALYILAKTYDAKTPVTKEAVGALAGSVVYDTVLRLANRGVNAADVRMMDYRILGNTGGADVQKLVKENSILRTELNKALQRLAGVSLPQARDMPGFLDNPRVSAVPATPDSPGVRGDFKYGGAPSPAVAERQREFGAMPWTPDVMERQRRFGAMPFEQHPSKTSRERRYGFMSTDDVQIKANSFGML